MLVVKIGGEVVGTPLALAALARDVASVRRAGQDLVIVHGGGPQGNALAERLSLTPRRVRGQRITDEAALQVMKMAMVGEVGTELQAALATAGVKALGLAGVSAGVLRARRADPIDGHDLELVGALEAVGADTLRSLLAAGFVPCVASLALGDRGEVLNVNADVAASHIARALRADALVLLTSTNGVRRDPARPETRVGVLHAVEARRAIEEGVIAGGMIPKVEEALAALEAGVGAVHIASGMEPGAWRREVRQPGSVGTVLVA